MRVAIAEDSGLFRSSLALLLRSLGAEVTASVASGAELIAAIRVSPPEVVILDIRMPPSFSDVTDADALMESLERVAAGETVVDPAIVRRLLGRKRKPSAMDTLNEREFAVLRHMAEGRSNLGIAKELYLSARTVETHVTSVFTKLGLTPSDTENNRVRAVLTFLRSAGPQG